MAAVRDFGFPDWLPGVDADFVWVVPGLAVGGQPTRQQMSRLRQHGIGALLSVRAEDDPEDSPDVAARRGLRYQRVVVADGIAIPQEAVDEIVSLAERWRRDGLGVLVHCQAARRRGPIAAAAILIEEGWSCGDAMRKVKAARRQTAPTPPQLHSLRQFARRRWYRRIVCAAIKSQRPCSERAVAADTGGQPLTAVSVKDGSGERSDVRRP